MSKHTANFYILIHKIDIDGITRSSIKKVFKIHPHTRVTKDRVHT